MNRTKEKIYGILFGQAIGDALGLAAERYGSRNLSKRRERLCGYRAGRVPQSLATWCMNG